MPFDPLPPVQTSGIRVGSPAGTTRGFGEAEFRDIADMVADVLDGLQANGVDGNGAVEQAVTSASARSAPASRSTRAEALRCPFCAHEDSQVKDSRPSEDGAAIRRRRQCEGCGARFTTFERVHIRDLTVVKKDGKREPFDRAKLERAISHSCRKRDIDAAKVDQLISGVQRQMETLGDEVTSARIGEAVMAGLKALDHVAYIRFASIYKDFSEPGDFAEIAERVEKEAVPPGHIQAAMSGAPGHRPRPAAARPEYRQGGAGDAQFRTDRDAAGAPRATAGPIRRRGPAASGADHRAGECQVFDTTAEAIADCSLVFASTVRRRDLVIPVVGPRKWHGKSIPRKGAPRSCSARSGRGSKPRTSRLPADRHCADQSRLRQPEPRPGGNPAGL